MRPLRGIYKTAWGAKLILMAGLVYPESCASLGHLMMAQNCRLRLYVCFSPPTAPPPPYPYRLNLYDSDTTANKKISSKTRGIQIAYRTSYEILAEVGRGYTATLESHSTFDISNQYFSKYQIDQFSKIRSHIHNLYAHTGISTFMLAQYTIF